MQIIAHGLSNGNPITFILLFMILYPPIMIIIFEIIDRLRK